MYGNKAGNQGVHCAEQSTDRPSRLHGHTVAHAAKEAAHPHLNSSAAVALRHCSSEGGVLRAPQAACAALSSGPAPYVQGSFV